MRKDNGAAERTFRAPRQSERRQTSDDPEHVVGEYRVHLPLCRIRSQQRQSRALGHNDLLLLLPTEGAKYGLGDGRGLEHGQRVEEHVGIARHGEEGDAARRSNGNSRGRGI